MKLFVVFSYYFKSKEEGYSVNLEGIFDSREQAKQLASEIESKMEKPDFTSIVENVDLNKRFYDCDEDLDGNLFWFPYEIM